MQINLVSGIYVDGGPDVRTGYPVNMYPVPKQSGISGSYMRPADGIVNFATGGPGIDKGGIFWDGVLYRVMGTSLVTVSESGAITVIGDVGYCDYAIFDYSFDYLGISAGDRFYLYDKSTLKQSTDQDLLRVKDFVWVDGYFLTTDGEYLVVTELGNPSEVNPLKYGSSELDPDPIQALHKIRNEVYSVNRHTIEVFANVGGELFPFERIPGAQIQKGAIGTMAACVYSDTLAFVGSGRNEPISVYIGFNGQAQKIATDDIDKILSDISQSDLASIKIEARVKDTNNFLYVHLPSQTLVYDIAATAVIGAPVWHRLISDDLGYRARNFVFAYGKWTVGDTRSPVVGVCTDTLSSHYGDAVMWEITTAINYAGDNGMSGAICHQIELIALTGRINANANPYIGLSYTDDGQNWSMTKSISAGKQGALNKRLIWRRLGRFRNWRAFRLSGSSIGHMSLLRLEAVFEVLS